MSAKSFIPLYVSDYLEATQDFTLEEHGALVLLMMHFHRHGKLPDSGKMTARMAKMSDEQWSASGAKLMRMFSRVGGRYSAFERLAGKGMVRRAPASARRAVLKRDGERCAYCGDIGGPFHIDHKHPWSMGGTHELDNLCVACSSCNLSKSNLPLEAWEKVYQ